MFVNLFTITFGKRWICPPNRTTQPSLQIDICGSDVSTTANIRDLGVYLDCTMSMTTHVTRVCGTAYGRLRNIARIRSSLPLLACKTLVHALVTSTLDFGNAALFGITGTLVHRLEMVQRAAGPSKHDSGAQRTPLAPHSTANWI